MSVGFSPGVRREKGWWEISPLQETRWDTSVQAQLSPALTETEREFNTVKLSDS